MICLWGALHFVAFLFAFFIIHTFFLYNFYYFAFCICITAWFFFFKLSLLSELATAAVQQRMTAVKSQSLAWSEKLALSFGVDSLTPPWMCLLRHRCLCLELSLFSTSLSGILFFFLIFAGKPSTVTTGDAKKNDGAAGAAVGDLQNYWVGG